MSLNRISYRNCKLYLLPGVKCIRLRREHKDFGELMMMGGGGVGGHGEVLSKKGGGARSWSRWRSVRSSLGALCI